MNKGVDSRVAFLLKLEVWNREVAQCSVCPNYSICQDIHWRILNIYIFVHYISPARCKTETRPSFPDWSICHDGLWRSSNMSRWFNQASMLHTMWDTKVGRVNHLFFLWLLFEDKYIFGCQISYILVKMNIAFRDCGPEYYCKCVYDNALGSSSVDLLVISPKCPFLFLGSWDI